MRRVTVCAHSGKLAFRLTGLIVGLALGLSLSTVPELSMAQSVSSAASSQGADRRDYVIGPGDVVRVSVFQNPDLTLETRVSESGVISYPLLGQVTVGGMTVSRAEAAIANGLRSGNFVRQPQVNVMVMQVRGNQASVLGQVTKPGRYPIETSTMRVSEMLAVAGGAAPGGSDTVVLNGLREGKAFRKEIDIGVLFTGATSASDPVIQDGDTLYVDRMPMVYIYGEVQRAGAMRLERGMTVMQVLAVGGGLTQRGTVKGLKVHRRDPVSGAVKVFQPDLTDSVWANDVVYVQESLF